MWRLTRPPWTMSPYKERLSCEQLCRFHLCGNEVQTFFQVGYLPMESAQGFFNLLHSVFVACLESLELSFCTHGESLRLLVCCTMVTTAILPSQYVFSVRRILDSRGVRGQFWRNRLFVQAFPEGRDRCGILGKSRFISSA